jgi:hypothetical protein
MMKKTTALLTLVAASSATSLRGVDTMDAASYGLAVSNGQKDPTQAMDINNKIIELDNKFAQHKENFYNALEEPEELKGVNGDGYRGFQTMTKTGRTCQKWTSQSPHHHTRTLDNSAFAGKGLGDDNYCRNPDDEDGGIWCYTTDSKKRWEYCDPLPSTSSVFKLDKALEDMEKDFKIETDMLFAQLSSQESLGAEAKSAADAAFNGMKTKFENSETLLKDAATALENKHKALEDKDKAHMAAVAAKDETEAELARKERDHEKAMNEHAAAVTVKEEELTKKEEEREAAQEALESMTSTFNDVSEAVKNGNFDALKLSGHDEIAKAMENKNIAHMEAVADKEETEAEMARKATEHEEALKTNQENHEAVMVAKDEEEEKMIDDMLVRLSPAIEKEENVLSTLKEVSDTSPMIQKEEDVLATLKDEKGKLDIIKVEKEEKRAIKEATLEDVY